MFTCCTRPAAPTEDSRSRVTFCRLIFRFADPLPSVSGRSGFYNRLRAHVVCRPFLYFSHCPRATPPPCHWAVHIVAVPSFGVPEFRVAFRLTTRAVFARLIFRARHRRFNSFVHRQQNVPIRVRQRSEERRQDGRAHYQRTGSALDEEECRIGLEVSVLRLFAVCFAVCRVPGGAPISYWRARYWLLCVVLCLARTIRPKTKCPRPVRSVPTWKRPKKLLTCWWPKRRRPRLLNNQDRPEVNG